MSRARYTNDLVRAALGEESKLFPLSYVEMEYSVNEAEYLEAILLPILH